MNYSSSYSIHLRGIDNPDLTYLSGASYSVKEDYNRSVCWQIIIS